MLSEVVTALHKTVDSLKTLKKMRRATAANVTEEAGVSDEARVKAQMLDDVTGLALQVCGYRRVPRLTLTVQIESLGVSVADIKVWPDILQLCSPRPADTDTII